MKMEEFDKSSLYYVDSTPEGTRYSLYDTASWKNGLAFKNIDFSETGLPVIKIAELNNGISSSTAYTDKTYSQDVFLTKGDYVFSWSGNPETSIDIYKYNLPDGWLNQHIFKVTPKTEIIDKGFFFYLMKFLKPYFKKIATNKQTTGLGHVTISDLQRMSVTLPPLPTQQKIAAILSSLDDKIELNNKINTNLEQQAQALFKNWFVDFEPFSGKMPEGWKVGKLSELINVKYGKDHKKLEDGNYPVYGSGGIMRYVEKFLYDKESVLIPRKGTLNNVFYINEPFWSVDTMFYTEMKKENIAKYVYFLVKSKDLNAMNAGSAVPSMTTEILNAMEVVIPSDEYLERFETIVSPMFKQIKQCIIENENLASIRDTLLPKLMNGEIEV